MEPHEIQRRIAGLQAQLNEEIEKYSKAIDDNSGFDVRKRIREEMRRIGSEIIALKSQLPPQTDPGSTA
jgi:hypothetical protein